MVGQDGVEVKDPALECRSGRDQDCLSNQLLELLIAEVRKPQYVAQRTAWDLFLAEHNNRDVFVAVRVLAHVRAMRAARLPVAGRASCAKACAFERGDDLVAGVEAQRRLRL